MATAVAPPPNTDIDLSQFRGHPVELTAFQGPLDLLLHLLKKDKLEIWQIEIARITRQYLDYIDSLQALNIEVAGDFLVMAATLLRMKSQMLLPRPSFLADDEGEEPLTRESLIERLLEYRRIKGAALVFREMETAQSQRHPRGLPASLEKGHQLPLREPRLFDLVAYFHDVLTREDPILSHDVQLEDVRLEDQMEKIRGSLLDTDLFERIPGRAENGVRFSRLIDRRESRIEVVVTFLAVLELGKLQRVSAQQMRSFSEIWLVALATPDATDATDAAGATDPVDAPDATDAYDSGNGTGRPLDITEVAHATHGAALADTRDDHAPTDGEGTP